MTTAAAGDRLIALLALITYLDAHPRTRVDEVAEHFGVERSQVIADVNTLWVSGTPGYMPDDLIDFSVDDHEQDLLTLTQARNMETPVKLSYQECLGLLAGVEFLAATPALADSDLVAETRQKLLAAAGTGDVSAHAIEVSREPIDADQARFIEIIREGLAARRRLWLRYVSVADVVTDRKVDPIGLYQWDDHWYLTAWCHRAGGVRHFRIDRITRLESTGEDAATHQLDESDQLPAPEVNETVDLTLAGRARYVAEENPAVAVRDLEGGDFVVTLPVLNQRWLWGVVLGLGDAVKAVDPPEYAQQIARRAGDALAAYQQLAGDAQPGSVD